MRGEVRVLKFGGSSLGNADCLRRAAGLVAAAVRQGPAVVVASAMSGVTDRLIEVARRSEAGDEEVHDTLASLGQQHQAVLRALPVAENVQRRIAAEVEQVIAKVSALCRDVAASRELTAPVLDVISSAGERLSSRLVCCALGPRGIVIEATALIVTDDAFGQAAPLMAETRERVRSRLIPLMEKGLIPVVAGFTGATPQQRTTTLGRGGSDYTATILGAALNAAEIIIWTDVDGVLSADPRLVPEAGALREISHREAAELARFGAKGFHPQTFGPLADRETPIWIRNSFAPERTGTRIRGSDGRASGVKAVVVVNDLRLVASNHKVAVAQETAWCEAAVLAKARADGILISRSLPNEIRFVVEIMNPELMSNALPLRPVGVAVDREVALVSVVGEGVRETPGTDRIFSTLRRHDVNIIALVQEPSEHSISLAVEPGEVRKAAAALHRELGLT